MRSTAGRGPWLRTSLDDPDLTRRARTFATVLAVFLLLGVASVPIVFFVPETAVRGLLLMFLGSFATQALGIWLSLRGYVDTAGVLCCSLTSAFMIAPMWRSGVVSDAIWFLTVGLLLSSFTSSPRVIWTVFVVDLLLIAGLESTSPEVLREGEVPLLPSVLSLFTTVSAAGSLYAYLSNSIFRDLLEQKAQAEKAREAAEAADRAKGMFLAMMSHELRTPLNAIIGYAELVAEDAELGEPVPVDDVLKIRGSGRHLLAIVDDLLELSSVESGRVSLRSERVDVQELVEHLVAGMVPGSNTLNVELEVSGCVVQTDHRRLSLVLSHLLSNALKFTEAGEVTLRVERCARHGVEGVCFTITDTGVGMDLQTRTRVFGAFEQGDGSSTRTAGGLGLGLTLTKRLLPLLQGELSVESEVGLGSTFTVWLPLIRP